MKLNLAHTITLGLSGRKYVPPASIGCGPTPSPKNRSLRQLWSNIMYPYYLSNSRTGSCVIMEAYASAEARMYLILKVWRKKGPSKPSPMEPWPEEQWHGDEPKKKGCRTKLPLSPSAHQPGKGSEPGLERHHLQETRALLM